MAMSTRRPAPWYTYPVANAPLWRSRWRAESATRCCWRGQSSKMGGPRCGRGNPSHPPPAAHVNGPGPENAGRAPHDPDGHRCGPVSEGRRARGPHPRTPAGYDGMCRENHAYPSYLCRFVSERGYARRAPRRPLSRDESAVEPGNTPACPEPPPWLGQRSSPSARSPLLGLWRTASRECSGCDQSVSRPSYGAVSCVHAASPSASGAPDRVTEA